MEVFPIFNPEEARKGIQRAIAQVVEKAKLNQLSNLTDQLARESQEGKVYAVKYERNKFQHASSWMYVHLGDNQKHLMLRDSIIEAELVKSIGEHPFVPGRCAICRLQLITENKPSEDHGVSCCAGRNGATSLAGGIMERAATVAIRYLDDTAERKPCLDNLPCLQRLNPAAEAKTYGDVLSTKCGRLVVIDVTFSSQTSVTLERLEQMKSNEYKVNRAFDPDHFVPFVITSSGAWGERMVEYFREMSDSIMEGNSHMRRLHKRAFRNARESISVGVCKANWVYMKSIREGTPTNDRALPNYSQALAS
jgi:hypothetical protein